MDEERLNAAIQCMIDNGIEPEEARVLLQALCYILLDIEIDNILE